MRKYSELILKFAWPTLIVILLITVWGLYSMKQNARLEADLDEYMPRDHPAFVYSDSIEALFHIDDAVMIALANEKGIYNHGTLDKVKALTQELGEMKGVAPDDITSLYSADNITGSATGLNIAPFYEKVPQKTSELKELREQVRGNEMAQGRIVSDNEEVTLLIARVSDTTFSPEFYHQLLDIANSYEGDGDEIYVTGQPVIEGAMTELMPKDMQRMVPVVLLIIVVVLYLFLRSIRSTLLTLLVVVLSTIWTFGLMVGLGYPIYAPSTLIPVMLIAIGVADGIHILSHLELHRRSNPGISKKDLIINMIEEMWKPVLVTSITTAIGFISLITSEVYPIKYFAVFTAFGVMSAMVLSLTIIPVGLKLGGLPAHSKKGVEKEEKENTWFQRVAHRFSTWVVAHKYRILVITLLVLVFFGFGINRVWINSSFLERFEKDAAVRVTDRFVNQHFGGTTIMNVILEGDKKNTFKEPDVLKEVDKMLTDVERTVPEVGETYALTDMIERMNYVLNEEQSEFDTIPDKKNLIAQYLLLYEMSGDPEDLWKLVDQDMRTANLRLQLKEDNTKALEAAMAKVEEYGPRFEELGIDVEYAGGGYKAMVFNDLILEGQIKSLLLSLVLVVILLAILFKSIKAGLMGAIPVTVTTVISFGVLGWLNIPLETTTALISSIAIGIGIDYAVHFMDRYKVNALRTGDKARTVKATMAHSGRAIFFNAVVVMAGFLVMLLSAFIPNQALGAIVSLNMFTSFLGTITLMFIALYLSNIYFKNQKK